MTSSSPRIITPHTAEHLADTFSILSDPGRIRIVSALLNGPTRVSDLSDLIGHSQSAVSHSLRLLKAHHVVTAHRHGREIHYELADDHIRHLLDVALAHIEHHEEHAQPHPSPGTPHTP
ncbi:ArsR/SmtB family transcription factor [Jonesia quinghaiensis]|uniref:ArsR/SmtB family transcription factor n=1 Tax=Jonesia quinghaiensis TaxID=262806 RepID=UPI00040190B9|nr:metalloregulator ArsR/SmtB family transcription factor [Jonesia quinghaiensis]